MKQIRITFVDEAISCVADLYEDKAPKTFRFIWDMLSRPVEGLGVHAMWTAVKYPSHRGGPYPGGRRFRPTREPNRHPDPREPDLERLLPLPVVRKSEAGVRFRDLLRPRQPVVFADGMAAEQSVRANHRESDGIRQGMCTRSTRGPQAYPYRTPAELKTRQEEVLPIHEGRQPCAKAERGAYTALKHWQSL